MKTNHRHFRIERMEARELMAGDIAASMVNGTLTLNEAPNQVGKDNAVSITQLSPGVVRVMGWYLSDGSQSLVNGAPFQDFTTSGNLSVNFGGGNDNVLLGEVDGSGNAVRAPSLANIAINTAAPTVTPGSQDFDNVVVWSANASRQLSIQTGPDDDYVYVGRAQVGTTAAPADLTVNTGSGADTLTIKNGINTFSGNLKLQTYLSLAETDVDLVLLDGVYSAKTIELLLGGGDDIVTLTNMSAANIKLDAGAGNDTAKINHAYAFDDLMANLGDGSDSLTVDVITAKTLEFLGGNGYDSLKRTADIHSQSLQQTSWELLNGIPTGPINPPVNGPITKAPVNKALVV